MNEFLLAVALLAVPCEHRSVPEGYVEPLVKATERYWPVYAQPWRCWWVAQVFAESAFDEDAVSSAGAVGLTQVLPTTCVEQAERLGITCPLRERGCNITLGTSYSGRMLRAFTSPRPIGDLLCWSAIAYNAGLGSALAAQRVSGSERCVEALEYLHVVTGHHANETRGYVLRISRMFKEMVEW